MAVQLGQILRKSRQEGKHTGLSMISKCRRSRMTAQLGQIMRKCKQGGKEKGLSMISRRQEIPKRQRMKELLEGHQPEAPPCCQIRYWRNNGRRDNPL